jgi:hypothetical protein
MDPKSKIFYGHLKDNFSAAISIKGPTYIVTVSMIPFLGTEKVIIKIIFFT